MTVWLNSIASPSSSKRRSRRSQPRGRIDCCPDAKNAPGVRQGLEDLVPRCLPPPDQLQRSTHCFCCRCCQSDDNLYANIFIFPSFSLHPLVPRNIVMNREKKSVSESNVYFACICKIFNCLASSGEGLALRNCT